MKPKPTFCLQLSAALAAWSICGSHQVQAAQMITSVGTNVMAIDLTTGAGTLVTPAGGVANMIGYDPIQQRLIYGYAVHDDWRLYSQSASLGPGGTLTGISPTVTLIDANLRDNGPWPAGSTSSIYDMGGAATFINGTYHFMPDKGGLEPNPVSVPILHSLSFDASGTPTTFTQTALGTNPNLDLGDFGDIAIYGGNLYGMSSVGLWKADLSNPGAAIVILRTPAELGIPAANPAQLEVDDQGFLWSDLNSLTTLTKLDPNTGLVVSTLTYGTPLTSEISDLAFVTVPEPSGMLLSGLGGAGVLLRRRRAIG